MARSTDSKKLAVWRGRFRHFWDSGLSVSRFCAAEQVSVSSFYYWRKRLGLSKRRQACRVKTRKGCVNIRRNSSADVHRDGRNAAAAGRGVFKPVDVVPTACGVVVRLPGGVRIEVDASQLDAIQAVVAATVQGVRDRTDGQSVSAFGEGATDGCVNGKTNVKSRANVKGKTNGKGNRSGAVSC